MAGVTASIVQSITAKFTGAPDIGTVAYSLSENFPAQFSAGTATIGQADLMFADTRTLTASATENLDLSGVLVNALGQTFTPAEIVAIILIPLAANTNDVLLGGAGSNAFLGPLGANTHTIAAKANEPLFLISNKGWPVTAGTGDLLKLANGGAVTSVTFDIIIIGRSVAA